MNKKESFIPYIVAFLTVLFAIISVAVYLTRGKSKFWLSKKMKIGALLLTLSATLTPYSCVSCYDMPGPELPSFEITTTGYSDIPYMNLDTENELKGIIHNRTGSNFSFSITDTLHTDTLQFEKILPLDGAFDSNDEDFAIKIGENITTGIYDLNFFTKLENDTSNHLCTSFRIRFFK